MSTSREEGPKWSISLFAVAILGPAGWPCLGRQEAGAERGRGVRHSCPASLGWLEEKATNHPGKDTEANSHREVSGDLRVKGNIQASLRMGQDREAVVGIH